MSTSPAEIIQPPPLPPDRGMSAPSSVAPLYRVEPVWRPSRRLPRAGLPEEFRSWLLDRESLTRRLQHICGQGFHVMVLGQGRERPMGNEARALGMRPGQYALIRQVYLMCGDVPWVYARTVIPQTTLTSRNRCLGHLQSRSLGAVLFADPTMERGEVEIARLTPRENLYAAASRGLAETGEPIWGRRSVFRVGGKPLLVSECFLPVVGRLHF